MHELKIIEIANHIKQLDADQRKIINAVVSSIRYNKEYAMFDNLNDEAIQWIEAQGLKVDIHEKSGLYFVYWTD